MKKICEGKAKILFESEEGKWIQYFKDDITAFNAKVNSNIFSKGIINNAISSYLMGYLGECGIKTHFIKKISEREQSIKPLKMIDVEFVVRNVAAGSIVKRLGIKEGEKFTNPIVELFFKNDKLNDPMINDDHVFYLSLFRSEEYAEIKKLLHKLNACLVKKFSECGLTLVDFKVELGYSDKGELLLGDEISPDSCRIWDNSTNKKLDKDIFRLGINSDLIECYTYIANKLGAI